MTYTTKCNGHCIHRIDTQATTIKTYQQEINRLRSVVEYKTDALDRALQEITKLKAEKRQVTQTLNRVSKVNPRDDKDWDSRPRGLRG